MNARTVDWAGLRGPAADPGGAEGLRERKKRQTRQLLTDTASELFLERGFDNVSVAEIAAACSVSQKTVFNYFPTKESLILDHPDATEAALRVALADPDTEPLDAAVGVLGDELAALCAWLDDQPDRAVAADRFRRFGALIQSTPALRAYQRDMAERLVAVAAERLAARWGGRADDPGPQAAATALLGLWPVQFRSIGRHLGRAATSARLRSAVTADLRRAAAVLRSGLTGPGTP
ncbi:TetR family transcriptional regulator [Dactylosporangium sp. CA-092794]|uniref:TetR family transcriptional regulator n=1 Tax=Dactylosporangium sp. CA-092794 TaxID=3239929 RepID=UPI003D937871